MDASDDNRAKSAMAPEEGGPANNPQPKSRERSNNPYWKPILVYDCKDHTLTVKNVGQSLCLNGPSAQLSKSPQSDLDHCHKMDIPPNRNYVPVFIDREASKLSTASRSAGGRINKELTDLYLDELGVFHRGLRSLGLLSTLYVLDIARWNEGILEMIADRYPDIARR